MVLVVALALLGLPYILVSCGGFPAKIREGAEANEEFSFLSAPPPPPPWKLPSLCAIHALVHIQH